MQYNDTVIMQPKELVSMLLLWIPVMLGILLGFCHQDAHDAVLITLTKFLWSVIFCSLPVGFFVTGRMIG